MEAGAISRCCAEGVRFWSGSARLLGPGPTSLTAAESLSRAPSEGHHRARLCQRPATSSEASAATAPGYYPSDYSGKTRKQFFFSCWFRDPHASRIAMLRMIAAFMILVLTMSHGSLGAAVPHDHGGSHDHATAFADHADEDHHAASPDEAAGDEGSDADMDGQPEASHVHLSVDAVPRAAFAPAVFASPTDKFAPHASSVLPSAAVPPLLEPPSA